jgi:hypothetical protein
MAGPVKTVRRRGQPAGPQSREPKQTKPPDGRRNTADHIESGLCPTPAEFTANEQTWFL